MSGAGIWSRSPVRPAAVERMLRCFVPSNWHVRLRRDSAARTVLGEASALPVEERTPHPNGVLVAGDLRLDGEAELSEALGVRPSSLDAAWLVAEAYQRWGLEFAGRLYGDFAFALWDPRARRLLLARDAGGSRPLFYATHGAHVVYSSHPRGLFSLAAVPRALDERAVLDHLAELPQQETSTLFAAVHRVPPAGLVVIDERGSRLLQHVDVTQTPERRPSPDAEFARELREALARAVEARTNERSAVMLSGGLDSSSVAALAQRAARVGGAITTISAIFPNFPECDERHFQAALVAKIGSRHREVEPVPTGAAGDFERWCRVFSEPSFMGPHWLAWTVAEAALREGTRTILTGIDGDRVVSHGGGRFADLARQRDWLGLARELAAVPDFDWARRARVFGVQAALSLLPPEVEDRIDALDPRHGRRLAQLRPWFRPQLLTRYDVARRLRAVPLRPRSTRHEHARILRAPDRNWDVELLDQLGTAFGIEFAQPFFDRRVMELCFSLPGSQKRNAGWSRYVLRNALRGLVPDVILDRRRDASFDRPYWAWGRGWLEAQASPELDRLEPYVNVQALSRSLANLPGEPSSGPVDFLWKCVVMSRWLHAPAFPEAESFEPDVQLM